MRGSAREIERAINIVLLSFLPTKRTIMPPYCVSN
jgi:hypothetical protein